MRTIPEDNPLMRMDKERYIILPEGKVYHYSGDIELRAEYPGSVEVYEPSAPERQYKDIPAVLVYTPADTETRKRLGISGNGKMLYAQAAIKKAIAQAERERAVYYFDQAIKVQEAKKNDTRGTEEGKTAGAEQKER